MPTTEVPTSPPGPPSGPTFRRKRPRREEAESSEFFDRFDKLEDERTRWRRQGGIWLSVVAHLLLFWLLIWGPKVLWHRTRVVNPVTEQPKDLTYLTLPPDALKQVQPKPHAPLSDKNRIAQIPHPKLEAPRQLHTVPRPGPPLPPPVPQKKPAPQEHAKAQPAPSQSVPRPKIVTPAPKPVEQAQISAPTPAPNAPNFTPRQQSAGQAIQQAMRNAGNQDLSGNYGVNAPSAQNPMNAGVTILSDTMGVDFSSYIQKVIAATYRSWLPLIPESARPPLDKQGRVGIRFKIDPDGSVTQMVLEFPSGDVALDRAAWGGITGASYPPLPKAFKGPYLELRFGFYYNMSPRSQ